MTRQPSPMIVAVGVALVFAGLAILFRPGRSPARGDPE